MFNIIENPDNGQCIIEINGRIDAANANEIQTKLEDFCEKYPDSDVIINAAKISYISSMGLRVLLKIYKSGRKVKMFNLSPELYDIFTTTGFDNFISVEKAYRELDISGCEIIGSGANGDVYRIDADTVVKVYKNPEAVEDIKREQLMAKKAFLKGVPTAISYEIVKVGKSYGSVFELLHASSIQNLLLEEPEKTEHYIDIFVDLLRKIHGIETDDEEIPDIKMQSFEWLDYVGGVLDTESCDKIRKIIENIPEEKRLIHGDYHMKNVMMVDGEPMIIDMDSLSRGNVIYEFVGIYFTYVAFGELDDKNTYEFMGLSQKKLEEIYSLIYRKYFFNLSSEELAEKSNIIELLAYVRMLRRTIKRIPDGEEKTRRIDFLKNKIYERL